MKWSIGKHGIKAEKKEKEKEGMEPKLSRRRGKVGGWERAKCDGLISPFGSCSKAILIRKETRHQGNERMPFMKFKSRKSVKEREETRESESYSICLQDLCLWSKMYILAIFQWQVIK